MRRLPAAIGGADVIRGRGGDDVLHGLRGDDVLRGGAGNDAFVPGPGRNLVRGGGGVDAVRYAGMPEPVVVDLAMDTVTGPVEDRVRSVENAVGTPGADRLIGNGRANRIVGRGGDDVVVGTSGGDQLLGGSGTDTVRYDQRFRDPFHSGVSVHLPAGVVSTTGPNGTIAGIENVIGSHYFDSLTGDAGDNVLDGGGEDDLLNGNEGVDIVVGGGGDDYVWSGPGGTAGHPEVVRGGKGFDTATFDNWAFPMVATDHEGVGWDVEMGDGSVFVITELEDLYGTPLDDRIHGGAGATEVLIGSRGGADDLDATDGFGDDYVDAAPGSGSVCVGDPDDDLSC